MWAALLPAAIGAAASFIGGERQNDANARQAAQTNALNVELSNTAHQREVADLRAAGLNPILSANRSGAGLPQLTTPQFQNTISPAVSTALDAQRTQASVKLQDAQARQREPFAMVADVLAKILDRFLPSSAAVKPDTPPITGIVSNAVTQAYKEIPEPLRRELEYLAPSFEARKSQFQEASRSLGPGADWRDVYNFIRRGFLDNSAKSTFQDESGKTRYNLTEREFHGYASKDPRYKKYYQNKQFQK